MFSRNILKQLIDATHIPQKEIATKVGIRQQRFSNICLGYVKPTMEEIIKMANYFIVPVDLLLNRCNVQQVDELITHYELNFMELRKRAYDNYVFKKKHDYTALIDKIESPYPYNMLEAMLQRNVDFMLTSEDLKGIERAMDSINPRHKRILLMYFKHNITLHEISESEDVSSTRIHQLIKNGLKSIKESDALKDTYLATHMTNGFYTLKDVDAYFDKKEEELEMKKQALEVKMKIASDHIIVIEKEPTPEPTLKLIDVDDIQTLKLSVRTYNALKRSGITTIHEVIDALDNDVNKLKSIPYFGKKCMLELKCAINNYRENQSKIDETGE